MVVSEETGIISLALEGKLYRNLDEMTLKGMLAELLGTHSAKADGNRKSCAAEEREN